MPKRDILSIADLSSSEILSLMKRTVQIANDGVKECASLKDKAVGIYFQKTSTRTRTSFTLGAVKLGASVIVYGPHDLQTNTGETIQDTARILSAYLDILVLRTAGSIKEMKIFADQADMSVINAMSDKEHPTQALADLATLLEHFGYVEGLDILYIGEGNNTAAGLALAISKIPSMKLTLCTPEGYGLPQDIFEQVQAFSRSHGAQVEQHHNFTSLPRNVDVVYTTRWRTTGSSKSDPNWIEDFSPFSVTQDVMARVSKPSGTIFMHDLPAVRGEDVDSEVLDGPQSIAFHQARNKLFGAMAALEWCALSV